MSRVSEFIKSLYGFSVRHQINQVVSSVGTSAELIARQNPNRIGLWVANNSANTLYVLPDNEVSTSRGFYIAPNGGNLIVQIRDDFILPSLAWYAIAGGAASAVTIVELITD